MSAQAMFGGFKMFVGIMGAKKQYGLDKAGVQLEYEDNLEKIRRREFTQNQVLGQTKAMTEASGVRHTGGSTAQGYLDTMTSEFKKEIEWMDKYTKTAKKLGLQQARNSRTSNMMDSLSSMGM